MKGIELTICKIGNRKPQKEDTGKSEFEKKFEEKEKSVQNEEKSKEEKEKSVQQSEEEKNKIQEIEKNLNNDEEKKENFEEKQEPKEEEKVLQNQQIKEEYKIEDKKENNKEEKNDTDKEKKEQFENQTPKKEKQQEQEKTPEEIAIEKQQKFLKLQKSQPIPTLVDETGNPIEIPTSNPKESSELLSILFKKITKSENKIEDLQRQIKALSKMETIITTNTDSINKTDNSLIDLQKSFDKFKEHFDENAQLMEDMRVKMADFNIYDLFKDNGDGNMDASKALIMTLENKVFKKFSLVDEKIKNNENDIARMKTDLTNNTNQVDFAVRSSQKSKELIDSLEEELSDFKKSVSNSLSELELKLATLISNKDDNSYGHLKDEIKKEITDAETRIIDNLKQLIEETKIASIQSSNPSISVDDLKLINDFNKRLSELEKTVKLSLNTLNIEAIKAQLAKFNEDMEGKLTRIDLNELYDKSSKLNNITKDLAYKTDLLVEANDKANSDIQSIIKKMESLTGQYASFQSENSDSKISNKGPIFDVSKYIDINKFNENNKIIGKQIEAIRLEEEDLRRILEDVINRLTHSPSEVDFKNYQATIKGIFDEQKLQNNKRYADKIDTSKNIRYLETQIKNIIDVYIKKEEGGDNWLIAKKPMSGYQCASCESNLKDLSKKYEYLPWNKYPVREDKAYRMGHGFSRMLQMVNMDILKTAEANRDKKMYDSDREDRPHTGGTKKLPEITARNSGVARSIQMETGNMSEDDPYKNSNKPKKNQPKVVKIYKKNRNNSNVPNTMPDERGNDDINLQKAFMQSNDIQTENNI